MTTKAPFHGAPSGFVIMDNYKEPFMDFVGGYGYEGAVVFDSESQHALCHVCGKWVSFLPNHAFKEHKLYTDEYKLLAKLGKNTSLFSPAMKEKMRKNGTTRFSNLKKRSGPKSQEEKDKIRSSLKAYGKTREKQNLLGTCPEQLKAFIKKKAEEVGRTPTIRELEGKYKTIVKTFGTYHEAIIQSGLKPRRNGHTLANHTG